jgi:Icc-related predicted phosphoesterase
MKLVLISDTHTMLDQVRVPSGDILIHAGDATFDGNKIDQVKQFNDHLGMLKDKFKHIIYVPGNHDFIFQDDEKQGRKIVTNADHILIDQSVEIEGIKFYGSPWQPWYHDWAFNFPERDLAKSEIAAAKWAEIPEDTQVLITHSPPYKMMDKAMNNRRDNGDRNVGCKALAARLKELPLLKVHVFGHIHEGYGEVQAKIHFVNASICTRIGYLPTNSPIVVNI